MSKHAPINMYVGICQLSQTSKLPGGASLPLPNDMLPPEVMHFERLEHDKREAVKLAPADGTKEDRAGHSGAAARQKLFTQF